MLIVLPLSFNVEPYFSFTPGMLSLDPEAFRCAGTRISSATAWPLPTRRSTWPGLPIPGTTRNGCVPFATLFHRDLRDPAVDGAGHTAAIGLSRSEMPYRRLIMSILISPMIVPLVITAAGMFFFYSKIQLSQTYIGVIMAHAVLGTPFVIITVTATLVGFDKSLVRAANSLGAGPIQTFFKVQMPLIIPGVISGGLFAFITSFDEVVAVLFLASPEQRTIPRQMWSGIREQSARPFSPWRRFWCCCRLFC